MRVVIVGNGNREKALYEHSQYRCELYPLVPSQSSIQEMVHVINQFDPDLVVIGPEEPLVDGIVDLLPTHTVFGPTKAMARLEGSKIYAHEICDQLGIKTPKYYVPDNSNDAEKAIQNFPNLLVVKADGLHKGKGVFVADTIEEALAVTIGMEEPYLLEERLFGQECSVTTLIGPTGDIHMLPTVRDYKRAFDGDAGLNTGGMGGYSPVPYIEPHLPAIRRNIIEPIVSKLSYVNAFLYVGIMLDSTGEISVLEFNVRLGDPETQIMLPLLKHNLIDYIIGNEIPEFHDDMCSVGVVLTDPNYPTTGKRQKTVIGTGSTFREARDAAYAQTLRFRTDIAREVVESQ